MNDRSPHAPPTQGEERGDTLATALQRMATDLQQHQPPEGPPAAAWAVVRRRAPVPVVAHAAEVGQLAGGAGAPSRRAPWAPWATAALCAGLLAGALWLIRGGAGDPRTGTAELAVLPRAFLPAAGGERWLRTGHDGAAAWVVHAELPRERLAEFGLPFDPSRAAEPVRAELLLRGDGDVLAVRVLAAEPVRP